jgi:putative nucleotidyltransferase with HDIG domain
MMDKGYGKPYDNFNLTYAKDFFSVKEDLPSNTKILLDTMGLLKSTNSSIKDIKKKISLDQGLTAFILKISNSPFYGPKQEIATLTHAISYLGYSNIRTILMSYFTKNLLSKIKDKKLQIALWKHSLFNAFVAQAIAESKNICEPEEAYISGLLHDIGKIVMFKNDESKFISTIKLVNNKNLDPIEVEYDMFGFSHLEIGYILSVNWNFTENIKYALLFHHSYEKIRDKSKLPAVISLTNKLSYIENCSIYNIDPKTIDYSDEIDFLGISKTLINESLEDIESIIEDYIRIYG